MLNKVILDEVILDKVAVDDTVLAVDDTVLKDVLLNSDDQARIEIVDCLPLLNRLMLELSELYDIINARGSHSRIRYFTLDRICSVPIDTSKTFKTFCDYVPLDTELAIIKHRGVVFLTQEKDKPLNSSKYFRPKRVIIHLMSHKETKEIKEVMKEVRVLFKVLTHKAVNQRLKIRDK